MRDHLRRNLLLGVALAAVIAGGIIALGAGGSHRRPAGGKGILRASSAPSDVQLAAEYLGLGRVALRSRLRSGETMAELAEATPGRSASGLIAVLLAPREAALGAHPPLTPLQREALSRARAKVVAEANHGRGRSRPLQAAASYLGLSDTALRARLRAGESLAQVAQAQGHSRAELIEALVLVKARRLSTALAEHAITPGEEKAALASLRARVAAVIDQRLAGPGG